jgi:membrane-bound metal-dependent hydrolase YbcI (DUF457 family)
MELQMEKISRTLYLIASSLFLLGIAIQVFLAGMVVVALRMGWANHRDLGHSLALPLLVMLVTAYFGKLPRNMKWFIWVLFAIYIIQADILIFMRATMPVASAFHPVLALVVFSLAALLTYQSWELVREGRQALKTKVNLEQVDKIGL